MSEPSPESPWLVADIGGTNARFGLVTEPEGRPHRVKILRCGYYPDLVSAVETYLEFTYDVPRPRAGCVAVAGPVDGDRFRLTNASWDFSVADSRRLLGFDRLELINDFTALALALPRLDNATLRSIGDVPRVPGKPVAVIGPGTGLGVAGLLPASGRWIPVSGEGGHVTIPAETEREAEVGAVLRGEYGTSSAESVLSGPGLVRLHRCLSLIHGAPAEDIGPEQVCHRGRHGTDPVCTEALQMFCALLGAFAGNVALTLGARGGVMLGGGILPSIADVLADSDFRRRFEGKPSMTDYLATIATDLIVAPTPALLGAASWLSHQQGALNAA